MHWQPTHWTPMRQLLPAGSLPMQRQAMIDMHQALLEKGDWYAHYRTPFEVNHVYSKMLPWQIRFLFPNDGRRTSATYHATKQEALDSRSDIIRRWQLLGLW